MHQARGRQERVLRIIAGQWRGRRFRFPPLALRPTPDRVRETLFNWLQPHILGAHCLDLYAGSGALGLEALSRGAAHVLFVEQQRAASAALDQLLRDWQASGYRVLCEQALTVLRTQRPARPCDVVFLDPPFGSGELAVACAALERGGWLAAQARIYLEHPRDEPLPALPERWRELRAGRAGEVGYHLFSLAGGAEQ
jgi:16S rRNA (guanine966-N2)-methyltransferase